ncbi:MAG: DnaD domain protein [Clostridia bacterium]|nr:DnaD domain protein [Clostridia bacterium]
MKLDVNAKSMLFSNTSIPDVFFTEYLSMASGNAIKVYLYMFFLSKYGKDVKINDLAKSLALDFKTIQDCIKFWEDLGLITKKTNGYTMNDLQEIELNKLYSPKLTASPEVAEKIEKSKYRAKAIETINTLYFQGVMSPSWYTDITLWFEKYKFDEQVMLALFKYCFDHSALHRNYIKVVANAWHQANIKTFSDLDLYYQKQEKITAIEKKIAKKLGLSRQLTEYEKAFIEKWYIDFGYDFSIIEIALKRTTSKSNPSFDYINKLLSDWNDRNLRTVDAVQTFLESMKQKQKDIKELKKKAGISNYSGRQYDNLDSLYANIKP